MAQEAQVRTPVGPRTIQIHRAGAAGELMEAMYFAPMDDVQLRGLSRLVEADYSNGSVVKALFSSEELGMSLTYAWFKPGYPLPRHSHSADCLYYIISGEMHYGHEVLMAGDCIFVPMGALYTFETGDVGLEFLEFRKAAKYDIKFQTTERAYDRQLEQTKAHAEAWRSAAAPLAARRMTGAV